MSKVRARLPLKSVALGERRSVQSSLLGMGDNSANARVLEGQLDQGNWLHLCARCQIDPHRPADMHKLHLVLGMLGLTAVGRINAFLEGSGVSEQLGMMNGCMLLPMSNNNMPVLNVHDSHQWGEIGVYVWVLELRGVVVGGPTLAEILSRQEVRNGITEGMSEVHTQRYDELCGKRDDVEQLLYTGVTAGHKTSFLRRYRDHTRGATQLCDRVIKGVKAYCDGWEIDYREQMYKVVDCTVLQGIANQLCLLFPDDSQGHTTMDVLDFVERLITCLVCGGTAPDSVRGSLNLCYGAPPGGFKNLSHMYNVTKFDTAMMMGLEKQAFGRLTMKFVMESVQPGGQNAAPRLSRNWQVISNCAGTYAGFLGELGCQSLGEVLELPISALTVAVNKHNFNCQGKFFSFALIASPIPLRFTLCFFDCAGADGNCVTVTPVQPLPALQGVGRGVFNLVTWRQLAIWVIPILFSLQIFQGIAIIHLPCPNTTACLSWHVRCSALSVCVAWDKMREGSGSPGCIARRL